MACQQKRFLHIGLHKCYSDIEAMPLRVCPFCWASQSTVIFCKMNRVLKTTRFMSLVNDSTTVRSPPCIGLDWCWFEFCKKLTSAEVMWSNFRLWATTDYWCWQSCSSCVNILLLSSDVTTKRLSIKGLAKLPILCIQVSERPKDNYKHGYYLLWSKDCMLETYKLLAEVRVQENW